LTKLLIDRGADISAADNDGPTPLYHATKRDHQVVAQLLLDKDVDPLTACEYGSGSETDSAYIDTKSDIYTFDSAFDDDSESDAE
jgi:hypothetical protein